MAGIGLPLIMAAVAAHSALKPRKDAPSLSSAIPAAEELEALGRFMTPAPLQGVPAIANASGMRLDGPDPFASNDYTKIIDTAGAAPVQPVRERNVVSAILIANDRRVAVIDETLVSVGSTLPGGFRVTAIENDHIVIVTPDGVRRMLAIRDSNEP